MRIATKSSSRAHRRFSLHRTKHNALRFLFFPQFLPPEKIFSYRSIRIIPALHPPSLSLSSPLPPFWSSRTNLYRARRGDGHATPVCVCVGFTLWRREHSYFHTKPYDFQRLDLWRKRENEGSRPHPSTLQPSSLPSSLCSAGWPSVAIFEYSVESGKNYVNRRIPRSAWKVEEREKYGIFVVRIEV